MKKILTLAVAAMLISGVSFADGGKKCDKDKKCCKKEGKCCKDKKDSKGKTTTVKA
jgi:hypothetical protein